MFLFSHISRFITNQTWLLVSDISAALLFLDRNVSLCCWPACWGWTPVFLRLVWPPSPPPAAPSGRSCPPPSDAAVQTDSASDGFLQTGAPGGREGGEIHLKVRSQWFRTSCVYMVRWVFHLGVLELRGQTGDVFTQLDVLPLSFVQQAGHAFQLHLTEQNSFL